MDNMCTDNRFKLIEKYKKKLIESTNIETSQDEMAVLDNLLFRFWQMGWLDRLEQPERKTGEWIPCSERLPDLWDEKYLVSLAWGGVGAMEYKSTGFHNYGSFSPVPIETVTAWMPLPEPYKGEET